MKTGTIFQKKYSVKWKTRTYSNAIEKVLMKRNIAPSSQAKGTLFTTTPLVKLISKDGCSPGADSIIDGLFVPHKYSNDVSVSHIPELLCLGYIQCGDRM